MTWSVPLTATDTRMRRLFGLLYLAGLFIVADQAADVLANLLAHPVKPESVEWRFGTFGLLATRASALLVGDAMLFAAAIGLGHAMVLRILGALHLLLAAAVGAALVGFALDMVQIRRLVSDRAERRFDSAALRAAITAGLGIVVLGWAGIAALRAGRTSSGKRRRPVAPLIEEEPSEPGRA